MKQIKSKFQEVITMRDIKRIRKFCNELATIWESQCPDWRFSQLVLNVMNSDEMNDTMPFYVEDEEMMKFIQSFFNVEVECDDEDDEDEEDREEYEEEYTETEFDEDGCPRYCPCKEDFPNCYCMSLMDEE